MQQLCNAPAVMLNMKELNTPLTFMIDTGALVNLVKYSCIPDNIYVDEKDVLLLKGITTNALRTWGRIKLDICNIATEFHLVDNDFPIQEDGILGTNFFQNSEANINYMKGFIEIRGDKIYFAKGKYINEKFDKVLLTSMANNVEYDLSMSDWGLDNLPFIKDVNAADVIDDCTKNSNYSDDLMLCGASEEIMCDLDKFSSDNEDDFDSCRATYGSLIDKDSEKLPHDYFCDDVTTLENELLDMRKLIYKHDIDFEFFDDKNRHGEHNLEVLNLNETRLDDENYEYEFMRNLVDVDLPNCGPNIFCINEMKNLDIFRAEKVLSLLNFEHLEKEKREEIEHLIIEYSDCFHLQGEKLATTDVIQHTIPTVDDIPVNSKPYRFPHALKEELDRQIQDMLANEIIEPSSSNYQSPVFLVLKGTDDLGNKRYRLVVDFRHLNEKTLKDKYPLPNILDIIDQVGGSQYFSTFDLAQGFYQIPLDPRDRHKTAFSTSFGLFQFTKMAMGLTSSPSTFSRMVARIFKDEINNKDLFIFIDDAVVHSRTYEEHLEKLTKFFCRLRDSNLKLQPEKCELLKKEVIYLGHLLSEAGVRPDPKKLEAVKSFPVPKTVKNIRQFLGLAGYYRRFIHNFSGIAKPLSNLLKNDVEFKWTEETQVAFDILRDKLCSSPLLEIADFSLPFFITCDASATAIGGILSQGELGQDRPIGYVSRVLTNTEQKYDTYSKEALAIVYTVT